MPTAGRVLAYRGHPAPIPTQGPIPKSRGFWKTTSARAACTLETTHIRQGAARGRVSVRPHTQVLQMLQDQDSRVLPAPPVCMGALEFCLAFPSTFLVCTHFSLSFKDNCHQRSLKTEGIFSKPLTSLVLVSSVPKEKGWGPSPMSAFCGAGGALPGHGLGGWPLVKGDHSPHSTDAGKFSEGCHSREEEARV